MFQAEVFSQRIGELGPIVFPDRAAKETLDAMRSVVSDNYRLPSIVALSTSLVAYCKNDSCKIRNIYNYVLTHLRFKDDPLVWDSVNNRWTRSERLKQTINMLHDIKTDGYAEGDCDDYSTFTVALCKAAGLRAGFIAVSTYGMGRLNHVLAWAWDRSKARVVTADGVAPGVSWEGHRILRMEA